MNLEQTIEHLKDDGRGEHRLVAEFVDDPDETMIKTSMDLIIEAATMVKDAATTPVLKIMHDEDPIDWCEEGDHLGTMVCWHRHHNLGDERPGGDPETWFLENGPFFVVLPLYLYDHSGLTMSTGPFSCPWDSGQVGWIYVTAARAREEYGVKALNGVIKKGVIACLEAEVRAYDQLLRGAVWGFTYGDDSCWSFFGDELEETGLLEHIDAPRAVIEAAWEAR